MGKKFELTKDQKRALELNKNLVVTAGAGSGKTAVLAERYHRILEEFIGKDKKPGIRNILVLTFTEKAAGEMKERIYRQILTSLAESGGRGKGELDAWQLYKDDFLDNRISTFHSFCSYVLRAHPLEAGVDPNFSVIEGFEQWQLLQDTLEKTLDGLAKANDPQLFQLLGLWSRRQLLSVLVKMINKRNDLYNWLEYYANTDKKSIFARWFDFEKYDFDSLFSPTSELMELLKEVSFLHVLPLDKNDRAMAFIGTLANFYKDLSENIKELDTLGKADLFSKLVALFLDSKGKYKKFTHYTQIGTQKNWVGYERERQLYIEYMLDMVEMLTALVPPEEIKLLPSPADDIFIDYLKNLADIYSQCLNGYQEAKDDRGRLDFNDLEFKAHELLTGNDEVSRQLADRFRYIMVDEFQDTNNMQWEIVKALGADIDGKPAPDKIFLVGDIKQAIYSFRGGDVKVFAKAMQELAVTDNFSKIVLKKNFRSATKPIKFFNSFFKNLLGEAELKEYEAPFERLQFANIKKEYPGRVELTAIIKSDDALADLEQEATLVGQKVEEALAALGKDNTADGGDKVEVAILLRRLTNVRVYVEALRRRGIAVSIVRGKGFYEQQEIYDLYNMLSFLLNQRDDIALVGVLRSPLLPFNDRDIYAISRAPGKSIWEKIKNSQSEEIRSARKLIDSWLFYKDRLPIAGLLRRITEDCHFYLAQRLTGAGRQSIRNIEKFMDLARQFDDKGTGLGEFIEFIGRQIELQVHEGESPTGPEGNVAIMSIHQAKGLEFPAVIIPDLGSSFNLGLSESMYINELDGRFEVVIMVPHPQTGNMVSPSLRERLKERIKLECLAEEKRVLYVGATRAERFLYLIGLEEEGKKAKEKKDREKDYYKLNSFLQWIWLALDIDPPAPPTGKEGKMVHGGLELRIISAFDIEAPVQAYFPLEKFQEIKLELQEAGPAATAPQSVWGRVMEVSPTGLSLYKECPLRYKFRDSMVPTALLPDYEGESHRGGRSAAVDPALLGSIFHKLMENDIFSSLQRGFQEIIDDMVAPEFRDIYIKDICRHLKKLNEGPWVERIKRATRSYKELYFKHVIYEDEGLTVYLNGIIDLLIDEAGSWRVIDFKTGALQGGGAAEIAKAHHYDIQLQCYNLVVEEAVKRGKKGVYQEGVIIFTETGEWVPIKGKDEDKEEILGIIDKIMSEEFEPISGDHCRYCEYKAVCPLKTS